MAINPGGQFVVSAAAVERAQFWVMTVRTEESMGSGPIFGEPVQLLERGCLLEGISLWRVRRRDLSFANDRLRVYAFLSFGISLK
jgi:hypothetical protein